MLKRVGIASILLLALLLAARVTTTHAAVALARFFGEWNDSGTAVRLQWETGSETNHLRFNLWRSTENLPINAAGQINTSRATKVEEFQPSNSACQSVGQRYAPYTDDTVDADIDTYYYYLESIDCGGTGSEFEGAETGGGLAVSQSGVTPPTATATATHSRTPTPRSQPSQTPSPTNSPVPTETPSPTDTPDDGGGTGQAQATNTPTLTATNVPQNNPPAPSATFTVTRAANQPPAAATNTRAAAAPASPTRQIAVAPPATSTRQPTQAPAPSNPQSPVNTPVSGTGIGVEVTPTTTFTDDGGAGDGIVEEPAEPESFDDLTEETTELAVAPESEVDAFTEEAAPAPETGGGVTSAPLTDGDPQGMSALPAAATPTIASVLAQLPPSPQAALVAAEVQSDPLDRVIQVVIALILLGSVALIGFIGWTLVRQQ